MIKVRYDKLIISIESFSKLAAENLTLKTAYKLRKLMDALSSEIGFFWEQHNKIMEKYPKSEDAKKCEAELDELLKMEIEIKQDALDMPITEDVKLTANDIMALRPFINFIE